ncbi:putative N-acetylmannosamine-6-phosphate 2-epimerase, partial [bacterium]|nr:putative N-acetylmannosamine-6-phosphate 2-epimerase [bacterium]
MTNMINRLKGKVVVSCQAMPSEPLYQEQCMIAMMKSVIKGGAGGLRVAGARDVKNAKKLFEVPVIGLTKPEIIPPNWQEIVYITPTINDVIELIQAGADIVAFDGTMRQREGGCTLKEIIKYIKINKRISMADISTAEEGLNAAKLGANILSTTLSGYTKESAGVSQSEPDFKLLEVLVKETDKPVV